MTGGMAVYSRTGGTYVVPPSIKNITLDHLRSYNTEAVCFWLASKSEFQTILVREVWIPAFTANALAYDITPVEMLRLKDHLDATLQDIVAQVHSHPGTAFHSSRDDLNAASPWPGYISIVVPNFGNLRGQFWDCAEVYELLGGAKWRHLNSIEKTKRFKEGN